MKIRSYAKSELAMLYFPNSNPHVATNHLTQWIKRCPPLVTALAGCYQSKNAKFFSPPGRPPHRRVPWRAVGGTGFRVFFR